MSPTASSLASFAFVPWLRRGAARFIGTGTGTPAAQTPIAVALQVGTHAVASPALALRGPGDVIGFDPKAVIRTWPGPNAANVEPEFLPLIEFDQADLPWRFTPAAAVGDQLSPWLCLVVAAEGEFHPPVPGTADRPLATVNIIAPAALPDLGTIYAWAHAEAIGADSLSAADAATLMQLSPQLIRSRILSSRQLSPHKAYTAFLVPALELGRRGGLRLPTTGVLPTTPAWTAAPVTLPVYYQWSFSTGEAGDFGALIKQLIEQRKADPLPDSIAYRDMDVSDVSAGPTPIGMEGALTTAAHPKKDLPAADQSKVAAAYADALAPTPPAVRPPTYGRAYLQTPPPATPPAWLNDLNSDPRTRAAAGLGAQVVRQHADALLAGAWAQIEGLREANQELQHTQLSRELARNVWGRHAPTDPDAFLAFVAPIATKVLSAPSTTLFASARRSTLAKGSLSAALRKIASPRGPAVLRQARRSAPALFSKMSSGAWMSATVSAPVTPVAAARLVPMGDRLGHAALLFDGSDPVATLRSVADPTGLAAAAATLLADLTAAPQAGAAYQAVSVPALQQSVASSIDPAKAVDDQANARTIRNDGRTGAAPFVVAPTFPQPMSAWLQMISKGWLLPGIEDVPQNTVALLTANGRFIEAFMAGLNHEMGQRLVFDEYPTDLTATYFQAFWSAGAADIAPINAWTTLGANPSPGAPTADPLVLLLRGHLVERYRNMVVSAIAATGTPAQPTLGTAETFPIFSGRMEPDVAFYGFPLTDVQALGSADTPGYFFVIAEHPSEPRFGGTAPSLPQSSAVVAGALLHHPVRLAVYAPALLKRRGGS